MHGFYEGIRGADTYYFGGGTPGLLSTRDLEVLCRCLLESQEAPPGEWTVEMAPSTVKADKIRMLRELGVTRISMGVQSFHEDLLGRLGRPHTPALARKAYDTIRAEGFSNVNLDMIFAVPGQTLELLESDLTEAVRLEPAHISTYCLTYEEDTPLWRAVAQGRARQDPEREADLYLRTWTLLEEAGYGQYEISNFARPGFECRHNLNTWRMHAWIGFGPAAASQYGGFRYANPPDLEAWLEGLKGDAPARQEEVPLTPALLAEDAVVFGLRMSRGIDPARLEERFPDVDLGFLDPLWDNLIREGWMERGPDGILTLTRKGKLVADRIAVEVMEAFDAK